MKCNLCGGLVTWRGPLTALTHTKCASCGGVNCQEVDEDHPLDEEDNVLYLQPVEASPLTFPLPTRCRVTTERGWATKPWSVEDVLFAKSAGAWFDGQLPYVFESSAARKAAFPDIQDYN